MLILLSLVIKTEKQAKEFSFINSSLTNIPVASEVALVVKNLPTNAGDARDSDSITGSGRSPRAGHGNPHQHPCLANPMHKGA